MTRAVPIYLFMLTLSVAGCGAPVSAPPAEEQAGDGEAVVGSGGKGDYFGEDDRQDPAAPGMPDEAVSWARSTALLVRTRHLEEDDQGLHLDGKRLGVERRLCGDDPYYWEPSVAGCSSFLVDDDIVVTAGHCADSLSFCDTALFVFDYGFYDEEPREGAPVRPENDPRRVTEDQLYRCKEVIDFTYEGNELGDVDYGIVRLDRPVSDREPLSVRREGRLTEDTPVTVIGYPDGIPVKIDMGGVVVHADETRFVSTSDTFASNSGSVVINSATGEVEAVHVSSSGDRYEQHGSCRRAKQCEAAAVERGDCQGAVGVYADVWRDVLFSAMDE